MADREKLIELIRSGVACPIDRDPFGESCKGCPYEDVTDCDFERLADALIANGVTVRERGRWEDVALRFTQVKEKCNVCGGIVYAHGFNFCPNCGADMRGEEE